MVTNEEADWERNRLEDKTGNRAGKRQDGNSEELRRDK